MSESHGLVAQIWKDLGVPAILAAGGAIVTGIVTWVRAHRHRSRRERARQDLRDRLLVLAVETNAGVLTVLRRLPCVRESGCDVEARMSEGEREQLAILEHDLQAVRGRVSDVWPNGGNGKAA